MRICTITSNQCMRSAQTCLAAQAAGHEVHLVVSLNETTAERRVFNDHMASIAMFTSPDQLRKCVENARPDIIHVHDRPHELAVEVMKCDFGVPVVVDVHDMDSLMFEGTQNPAEQIALVHSDGLVFVSDANQAYAQKKYDPLPPNIVVHSSVMSSLMPLVRQSAISGAVWEGGLYVEPENSPRRYIDQRTIVERLRNVGQSVFVYPAEDLPGVRPAYETAGAIVMPGVPLPPLLSALTRYEFGWYGQTADHRQIHDTLPNKMFEYIAAGLPVLVINAREAGKFVEQHGLGIHVEKPEDIVRVKKDLVALRPNVWEKRHGFCRENDIKPLLALYDQLIAERKARAEPQVPQPFVVNA